MNCPFPNKTRGVICPICKVELQFPRDPMFEYDEIPKRNCPVLMGRPYVPQLGLGDMASLALNRLGITTQRWTTFVTWLVSTCWQRGYRHVCRCCERRAWLNDHTPHAVGRLLAAFYIRFKNKDLRHRSATRNKDLRQFYSS